MIKPWCGPGCELSKRTTASQEEENPPSKALHPNDVRNNFMEGGIRERRDAEEASTRYNVAGAVIWENSDQSEFHSQDRIKEIT